MNDAGVEIRMAAELEARRRGLSPGSDISPVTFIIEALSPDAPDTPAVRRIREIADEEIR